MGPDVTLETVKATRGRLDTYAMDVQATNPTLTKQIDNRDDCAKLANQYLVRARKAVQGYFGPDSAQYAQVGGTRASDRKSGAAGPRSRHCPRQHKAGRPRGAGRSSQSPAPVAPAGAMSATAGRGHWTRGEAPTRSPPAKPSGTDGRPTSHGRPVCALRAGVSFRHDVHS